MIAEKEKAGASTPATKTTNKQQYSISQADSKWFSQLLSEAAETAIILGHNTKVKYFHHLLKD